MDRVSHGLLTGSELHEPKGISVAPKGTRYLSDGSGSGTWAISGNDIINCHYYGTTYANSDMIYRTAYRQNLVRVYLRGVTLVASGVDYVEVATDDPATFIQRYYVDDPGLTVDAEKITIDLSVQALDTIFEQDSKIWFNTSISGALAKYPHTAIMHFNEAG